MVDCQNFCSYLIFPCIYLLQLEFWTTEVSINQLPDKYLDVGGPLLVDVGINASNIRYLTLTNNRLDYY